MELLMVEDGVTLIILLMKLWEVEKEEWCHY
jgi:hypothetical protein